jgi:NTP pyrophosphatase (non-canonical NTP hydrolase)
MTLNEMSAAAYENSRAHGFHDGEDPVRVIPEKLCLIHEEVSEALGHYRNKNRDTRGEAHPAETVWADETGKPDGFAVELADAVIRIGDLCGQLGIDLEAAVRVKMEYNKNRPYMHGKVC